MTLKVTIMSVSPPKQCSPQEMAGSKPVIIPTLGVHEVNHFAELCILCFFYHDE